MSIYFLISLPSNWTALRLLERLLITMEPYKQGQMNYELLISSVMNWLQSTLASVRIYSLSQNQQPSVIPLSVNYFPHRSVLITTRRTLINQRSQEMQLYVPGLPRQYVFLTFVFADSCEFCFSTTKNLSILPIDEAKRGLRLLADAGMVKLNISGGEPFLKPEFIGEIFRFCKEELCLESCSVVNNGSKVTEKWLDTYGQYLDVMAISCDSFDPEVNVLLGRAENGGGNHIGRVFQVAEWCRQRNIKVKINSVITK
jgi:radical S-adenosyl methionine domain-containing protein 2